MLLSSGSVYRTVTTRDGDTCSDSLDSQNMQFLTARTPCLATFSTPQALERLALVSVPVKTVTYDPVQRPRISQQGSLLGSCKELLS